MPRFIVVGFDADQEQTFFDLIEAKDNDAAEQIVADVRDYATVTQSLTLADVKRFAKVLKSGDAHDSRANLAAAIDSGNEFCSSCDEPSYGGEGWDGLCGNCADRIERNKAAKTQKQRQTRRVSA